MSTITVELVTSNGSIDQAASQAAFATALSAHVAEVELQDTLIAEKVAELFAEYKGRHIQMPTLASMVTQRLGGVPENFKTLSSRVLDYVRANAQGDNSLLVISKGKNGGASLRADATVKTDSQ